MKNQLNTIKEDKEKVIKNLENKAVQNTEIIKKLKEEFDSK